MNKTKLTRALSYSVLFTLLFLTGFSVQSLNAQSTLTRADEVQGSTQVQDWEATKVAYYDELERIESDNTLDGIQKSHQKIFFKALIKSLEKGNSLELAKRVATQAYYSETEPDDKGAMIRDLHARADSIVQ